MGALNRCSRAWLSFLLLQDMGVMWMCHSGQASLLFKNAAPLVARQYSLAIAGICIIRLFLLGFFDSFSLHVSHIAITILYSLSMLTEMFYYKTVETSVPNVVRVIIQVATIIGFSIGQRWLCALPQIGVHRKKGRLFAKHYMEGDLLTPPDTEDVRELKKQL